jgi:hypothetical protein
MMRLRAERGAEMNSESVFWSSFIGVRMIASLPSNSDRTNLVDFLQSRAATDETPAIRCTSAYCQLGAAASCARAKPEDRGCIGVQTFAGTGEIALSRYAYRRARQKYSISGTLLRSAQLSPIRQ